MKRLYVHRLLNGRPLNVYLRRLCSSEAFYLMHKPFNSCSLESLKEIKERVQVKGLLVKCYCVDEAESSGGL